MFKFQDLRKIFGMELSGPLWLLMEQGVIKGSIDWCHVDFYIMLGLY